MPEHIAPRQAAGVVRSPYRLQSPGHRRGTPAHNRILEFQVAAGNSAVATLLVQRQLGKNVDLLAQEHRFFETVTRGSRLRVDSQNDAYLEDLFKEASLIVHTNESLENKLAYLLDYFENEIPYNKAAKVEAFKTNVQPAIGDAPQQKIRSLGTMLHAHAATCWEKAAFFHLILAEMGIASAVEGGYAKSDGVGHAWTVLTDPAAKSVVIDPTWNTISKHSDYEDDYNITVAPKAVATPRVSLAAADLKSAVTKVHNQPVTQQYGYKEFMKPLFLLKIERARNEARIEQERLEFDKLLAGLRFS